MAYQHYRSPFGDTTFTKVFVGGLAWETPTDVMQAHFDQFGDILEAVIITDKNTGKSKGYGFVTFRDAESARRACAEPNPVIDGRRANCNIASLGRPRPSPPRGRNQGGGLYHGGVVAQRQSGSSGAGSPLGAAPPPLPPPVIYPPYGYPTYSPDYGYSQNMYNPQVQVQQPQYYHPHLYGASSSTMASPYYYGMQSPRPTFSAPQAQRIQPQSYLYYPTHFLDHPPPSFSSHPTPLPTTTLLQSPRQPLIPSSTDSQTPQQNSTETEGGAITSESQSNTT